MEFLRSFLRRNCGETTSGVAICRLFSQAGKNPRFVNVLFPCAWPLPSRSTLSFLLFRVTATYIGRRKLPFLIRELLILMLSLCLKVQTDPEEVKQRDLWVTDFIPMQNIYKLALALTSKEIGNLIYQSFCTMY